MSIIVACKLPHGLSVVHQGRTIRLNGANFGVDQESKHLNDRFGLTELDKDDETTFIDWMNAVTYKNGNKADGKLADPFPAIENGAIMVFKNRDEAAKEFGMLAGSITTGTEGIDPETDSEMKADGIEAVKDDAKKG